MNMKQNPKTDLMLMRICLSMVVILYTVLPGDVELGTPISYNSLGSTLMIVIQIAVVFIAGVYVDRRLEQRGDK